MVHPGHIIRWRQLHNPVTCQYKRTGEAVERRSEHLRLSSVFIPDFILKVLPPVYQDGTTTVGKNICPLILFLGLILFCLFLRLLHKAPSAGSQVKVLP